MLGRILMVGLMTAAIIPAQNVTGDPQSSGGFLNRQFYNAHRLERQSNAGAGSTSGTVLTGDTVIPQVVDGDGWKTTLRFVNLSSHPVTFNVLFLSDSGTDMSLPIVGVGSVINVAVTLPVADTVEVESAGNDQALTQGWAYLLPQTAGDSISGFAIFRQRAPGNTTGRADQETAVPIVNQFGEHFALMYDNTKFATGLAVANASATESVAIPVNVRDQHGNIIDSPTISLGPGSHTAFELASLWPSTAGGQGTIEFMASGLGIGALGLRFNGSSFTGFPILSNFSWTTPAQARANSR
jgi:hypothetical protein